ncbi:MAG: zinc ribbon domain-containing protein [Mucilaginibacter sp.]|uniref:zinc ribbon domain-containing protein n=1 Tax=Mucilaginibacter sp. TaxID=1882438 RepID=UPI0032658403
MHLVLKEVRTMGFTIKGNSAIQKVLSNCVYAGMIKVPADKKQPDRLVKAIHMAIVSKADFWIAQEMLGNKRPSKTQPEERFPLRGILKCWCGQHMTAGFTKGKRNYYLYYRCIKHTGVNISRIELHKQFKALLDELSFSEPQIKKIRKLVKGKLQDAISEKENSIATKSNQIN